MRSAAAAVVLLMLVPMLSGCFGGGDEPLDEPESVFETLCPKVLRAMFGIITRMRPMQLPCRAFSMEVMYWSATMRQFVLSVHTMGLGCLPLSQLLGLPLPTNCLSLVGVMEKAAQQRLFAVLGSLG